MPGQRSVVVNLVRAAKKAGGDRYESKDGFVIYIPQDISRPTGGIPLDSIKVTFEVN